MSAFAYLQEVLTDKYDIKPEAIRPEATLEELGLDSLSVAELLFEFRDATIEAFDLRRLPADEIE